MDDNEFLTAIHRGRPTTVQAAATMIHLDPADVRATVDRWRARGLLEGTGDEILYVHPLRWASSAAAAATADVKRDIVDLIARVQESTERVDSLVANVPDFLRQWAVGESPENPTYISTRHGPLAAEDMWWDEIPRGSGSLDTALPEIERFLHPDPERVARFAPVFAAKERIRVILPSWASRDPAALGRVRHYEALGMRFRFMDHVPSWFWVDGEQVALPFEWGEGRPTSVFGIRNPSLAAMARAYFQETWQTAFRLQPTEHVWSSLLLLMRRGSTLEAAAQTLQINPRTARRRITAAMEHYGVTALFSLGVAFGAETAANDD